jgi:hypothetical protein
MLVWLLLFLVFNFFPAKWGQKAERNIASVIDDVNFVASFKLI